MFKLIRKLFKPVPMSIRSDSSRADVSPVAAHLINAQKFESRAPAPQNAIDLFSGRWASSFGGLLPGVVAGDALHFTHATGPQFVLNHFAGPDGDLSGQRILELGPLEAGHTYALSVLNPESIVAVEANAEAYLKCLISKEILDLKCCRFLFGDFVSFLSETEDQFDIIFASGVLYHMSDPIKLLKLISQHSKRAFFWTHYYTPDGWPGLTAETVERAGDTFTYYVRYYHDMSNGRFWGGNKPAAALLTFDDLLRACKLVGFDQFYIDQEEPNHPNGPAVSFTVWKSH